MTKAIANSTVGQVLVGQVLTGPLFLKVPFYKKQVINKTTRVILDLFSLLYYDTVDIKNMMRWKIIGQPRMQKICMLRKVFYIAKIKQGAEVICRNDRLRTAHSKRQTSHMSIGKLIGHLRT